MNEYAVLHIPDSRYCFATDDHTLVLRLRMSREDEQAEVFLLHACKYEFQQRREKKKMEIRFSDKLYHYYEIELQLSDVRFAYVFLVEEDGKSYYISEDGVTETYCFEEGFYNFFQMPYINRNDLMPVVDWMQNAVFYQIFVDRFACGDREKEQGYINMKWGDLPTPKSFAGGDLRGIIEKLSYLEDLGVTAIYLTPVFASKSNHKYDIIDYMQIDPQFGTLQDLQRLVELAHSKGIHVVLDAVFNHCSMELEQFQDVLKQGKKSKYYHWFLIEGDYPEPEKMNYECFASCNYMPKLNTGNEQVQEFILNIVRYWMRQTGMDGWRLDVSDEVSHNFWRRFRMEVKKENPQCVIIGENWHDAYPYLMGDQYDSIMNYAFTKACLDYFARETFTAREMSNQLNAMLMRNTRPVNRMMLNLLDSHDTHRFFSELKGNQNRLEAALALEMIMMGAPCIYYGTEICLEGGYDPDSRRCFDWERLEEKKEFRTQLKKLIALRMLPEISYGTIQIQEQRGMLRMRRSYQEKELTLWINLTGEERIIEQNAKEEIRCQNRYKNIKLLSDGYVVTRR